VPEAAAELDGSGGASLGLVAWDLCVEEHEVARVWERAIVDGLLSPPATTTRTASSCGA